MDQNALILNQSSSPCATNQCGSLLSSLKRSLAFRHIEEQSAVSSGTGSFVPDFILLRLSVDQALQERIESCRESWNRASILVLFCPRLDKPVEDSPCVFNCMDDFLFCPFQETELVLRVKRVLQSRRTTAISMHTQEVRKRLQVASLVGESPCFLRVVEKIPLLAHCDRTVLLSGETGTGKEVIARAIHYQGPRRGKPFIPVNCGALPDHLFENELFGHTKGAFTDASSAEKGLIAEAEGGTLFLDEVDALSHSGQVKLLRFLQDGEYRPVGSPRSVIADVRVIAATNADLTQRVRSKLFREDLYYRLNSLSLSISALRERVEDVALLAAHFLMRYSREHDQKIRQLSPSALQKMMSYSWPGNIRELESVITRALVLTGSQTLREADIDLPTPQPESSAQGKFLRQAKISTIQAFERSYLVNLLTVHRGNISRAAKAAGKERRTFQRLLQKYHLDRHSFRI